MIGDNLKRTIIIECWSAFDDAELGRKIGDEIGHMVQIESLSVNIPKYELRYVEEKDTGKERV